MGDCRSASVNRADRRANPLMSPSGRGSMVDADPHLQPLRCARTQRRMSGGPTAAAIFVARRAGTQPGLGPKKGRTETMTHDYKRKGTAVLHFLHEVGIVGELEGAAQIRLEAKLLPDPPRAHVRPTPISEANMGAPVRRVWGFSWAVRLTSASISTRPTRPRCRRSTRRARSRRLLAIRNEPFRHPQRTVPVSTGRGERRLGMPRFPGCRRLH
jgi:hypothetical protein